MANPKSHEPDVAGTTHQVPTPLTFDAIAAALGLAPNLLALQIDAKLGETIWSGTSFEDRTSHLTGRFATDLIGEIERGLLAQEDYGEFETRLFGALGIDQAVVNKGVLGELARQMEFEARLAWNSALLSVNGASGSGTDLEWTLGQALNHTAECLANNGHTLAQLGPGATIPAHWGCVCRWKVVRAETSDGETSVSDDAPATFGTPAELSMEVEG